MSFRLVTHTSFYRLINTCPFPRWIFQVSDAQVVFHLQCPDPKGLSLHDNMRFKSFEFAIKYNYEHKGWKLGLHDYYISLVYSLPLTIVFQTCIGLTIFLAKQLPLFQKNYFLLAPPIRNFPLRKPCHSNSMVAVGSKSGSLYFSIFKQCVCGWPWCTHSRQPGGSHQGNADKRVRCSWKQMCDIFSVDITSVTQKKV